MERSTGRHGVRVLYLLVLAAAIALAVAVSSWASGTSPSTVTPPTSGPASEQTFSPVQNAQQDDARPDEGGARGHHGPCPKDHGGDGGSGSGSGTSDSSGQSGSEV